MAEANFIDYVKIFCQSGKGGAGSMHFYRDKLITRGGPDGGDGARGGHIIIKGNRHKFTLLHLRYQKHTKAPAGGNGSGNNRSGVEGEDVIIEVPLGTVVNDAETGDFIFEITEHDEEVVLMQAGRGGLGNTNFKSSTNQSPRYAQPGEDGEEGWVVMELKVLADVGLVGFPNVGKSTLLSVVSAAKPKIANYEFTTLAPNLGLIKYRNDKSFVMADIPGIIEGASEGKGLGLRFLRHIERNSVLLFMIPVDADDIKEQYNILLNELKNHNPELLDKERILALTKSDMLDDELMEQMKEELPDMPYVFISSVAQKGLVELKDILWKAINS